MTFSAPWFRVGPGRGTGGVRLGRLRLGGLRLDGLGLRIARHAFARSRERIPELGPLAEDVGPRIEALVAEQLLAIRIEEDLGGDELDPVGSPGLPVLPDVDEDDVELPGEVLAQRYQDRRHLLARNALVRAEIDHLRQTGSCGRLIRRLWGHWIGRSAIRIDGRRIGRVPGASVDGDRVVERHGLSVGRRVSFRLFDAQDDHDGGHHEHDDAEPGKLTGLHLLRLPC
jgi:hypothetical protein